MCGIVVVSRKDGKPAAKAVLKRFEKQRMRGQKGFGFVAIQDNKVVAWHRSESEEEIRNALYKVKATEIWFHHRMPTSTPNFKEAAHPLLVENKALLDHSYFILHNGVITNDDELYKEHVKLGFSYETKFDQTYKTKEGKEYVQGFKFNDSESLAIDAALALEGKQGSLKTRGSAAVVGLVVDGHDVIARFAYRNDGNPLKIKEDKHMFTMTSEGEGEAMPSDHVYLIEEMGKFRKHPALISTPYYYASNYSRNHYPHDDRGYGASSVEDVMGRLNAPKPPAAPVASSVTPVIHSSQNTTHHFMHPSETHRKGLYEQMTDDRLWEHYDVVLGTIADLGDQIMALEAAVEYDSYSPDIEELNHLRDRFRLNQTAKKEIDEEISKRGLAQMPYAQS